MKKLLTMLLAGAMLLTSVQMTAMAQTSVPTPEDGVFNIAGFGKSNATVGSTDTTGYVNALETVVNNECGAGFAKSEMYGQYNFDYSWSNLENMIRKDSELVLIDTAFFSNNANDGELLEDVLLTLATHEKVPYAAIIIPSGDHSVAEALAANYGIDVIKLKDSTVTTAEGYAEYIFDNLTYTTVQIPKDGTKIYPTSYPATSLKVMKNVVLQDETKVLEAEGSSILMNFTFAEGAEAKVSIDGSKWSDPITSNSGIQFSRYHLPNTNHYITVKATGKVTINFLSADRITCADEVVNEGFEEQSTAGLFADDKTKTSVVKGGADGSVYALDVNNTVIKFPVIMEQGKEYQFTAKVKSKTANAITPILYRHADCSAKEGGVPPLGDTGWNTLSDLSVTPGEWTTIKTTFTPSNSMGGGYGDPTKYGYFALRMSDAEYLIDDVSIAPVEEPDNLYFDFNNLSYPDKATYPGCTVDYDCWGNYGYADDGNGGKCLHMPGFKSGNSMLNINNYFFKTSSIYKISFKARACNDYTKGKKFDLLIDAKNSKAKSLVDSNGGTPVNIKDGDITNYPASSKWELSDTWQEYTYYYVPTTKITVVDVLGVIGIVKFRMYNEDGTSSTAPDGALGVDMDDFSIERINTPIGASSIIGNKPSGVTASFEGETLNITSGEGVSAYFAVPFEDKNKYTFSFDVKGEEGMTIKPIISATIGSPNHYAYPDTIDLTGEWQHYSYTLNYSLLGDGETLRYPELRLRLDNKGGNYSIKNFKYELVEEAGIRNIESTELKYNKVATIDFDDLAATSLGYAYTIYAKKANGEKVIYKEGTSDINPIKYYVNAPIGTTLYARIAANTNGVTTKFTEQELGTVSKSVEKCTIVCDRIDDDNCIGYITVENNNVPRSLIAIIAQYDANTRFLDCIRKSISLSAYYEDEVPVEFELNNDATCVKLFAFDENYAPYCIPCVLK